ncbi:MAG: GFA family protein [Rickettsiaceae bacterium]|nr:GFA family protein [Rickettsiaceae bacterium]
MKRLTGKCLCGTISYEVAGELGAIYNCHCSKCRRWHGAAFRTRASVKRSAFKWLSGEEFLSKYDSSDNITKTFCSICGSPLISLIKDNQDFIGLPLGGLDQDHGKRPIANIFVGYKAPWYEINDGLPQYDAWPPGGPSSVRAQSNNEDIL